MAKDGKGAANSVALFPVDNLPLILRNISAHVEEEIIDEISQLIEESQENESDQG